MDLGSLTGILLSTLLSTLLSGGAQTTPTTQAVLQAFNDVKITTTTMVVAESEQETAAEQVDLVAAINENVQEVVTETAPVIVVADVAVENQIFVSAPVAEEAVNVETAADEYVPVEQAPVVEETQAPVEQAPVVEETQAPAVQAPVVEEVVVPEIPEEAYEEPYVETSTPSAPASTWNGQALTAWAGVVEGPNGRETYYNLDMSGVVNIMQGLGYDYEYWVRDDGVKMYGDYVMVAADLDLRPRGSIYETSLGYGIVCDTGSFIYGDPYQTDIAVNW